MGRERQHGLVVVFKACAIFAGVFVFMLYMGKVLGLLWEKVMAPSYDAWAATFRTHLTILTRRS